MLTFDEIRTMPSYEGYGGFFTTVGMVNGPFKCKGVPVEVLCKLVGGINASNTVRVSVSLQFNQSQIIWIKYPKTLET